MIDVWGRPSSSNVAKVLWTLRELQLDYRLHQAGGEFGGLGSPDYLAMNPNGRVPVLVDGELVVWESNAVVRYLAAQYGADSLWPTSAAERAGSDKWMDWATLSFAAALSPVRRIAKSGGAPQELEAARQRLDEFAAILDAVLAGSAYAGSARLGIGDIALGPHVHRWSLLDFPPGRHAALRAYHRRLCEHAGFRHHVVNSLA